MISNFNQHFDYVFIGAGASGLSLLYRITKDNKFDNKLILVIEPDSKQKNDRTWCFWSNVETPFNEIVYKSWDSISLNYENQKQSIELQGLSYKMIKGIDFYNFTLNQIKIKPNVIWINDSVTEVIQHDGYAIVNTNSNTYKTNLVFDSRPLPLEHLKDNSSYFLLQHFLGWQIACETDVFNEHEATLMDFDVPQNDGVGFMYVLPFSKRSALIEYTLFSPKALSKQAYEQEIKQYINQKLKLHNYSIQHVEYGEIPMCNYTFTKKNKRLIYLGSAGGMIKPSTGYAFSNIQIQTQLIYKSLLANTTLNKSTNQFFKYNLYDSIFLRVLVSQSVNGGQLLFNLFKYNRIQTLVAFLTNTSTFWQDLQVMNSVSKLVFVPAAIQEILATLINRIKRRKL